MADPLEPGDGVRRRVATAAPIVVLAIGAAFVAVGGRGLVEAADHVNHAYPFSCSVRNFWWSPVGGACQPFVDALRVTAFGGVIVGIAAGLGVAGFRARFYRGLRSTVFAALGLLAVGLGLGEAVPPTPYIGAIFWGVAAGVLALASIVSLTGMASD